MIQLLKYSYFHWSIAKNVLSTPLPVLEDDGMEAMDPALGVELAWSPGAEKTKELFRLFRAGGPG